MRTESLVERIRHERTIAGITIAMACDIIEESGDRGFSSESLTAITLRQQARFLREIADRLDQVHDQIVRQYDDHP